MHSICSPKVFILYKQHRRTYSTTRVLGIANAVMHSICCAKVLILHGKHSKKHSLCCDKTCLAIANAVVHSIRCVKVFIAHGQHSRRYSTARMEALSMQLCTAFVVPNLSFNKRFCFKSKAQDKTCPFQTCLRHQPSQLVLQLVVHVE
jgi:hypothetical protein